MKVLQFTIPVAHDKAVIIQEDVMPYFYPYLHRHREAQLILKKGLSNDLSSDRPFIQEKTNGEARSNLGQSLLNIGDDVINMFDADRQAHEVGRKPSFELFLVG